MSCSQHCRSGETFRAAEGVASGVAEEMKEMDKKSGQLLGGFRLRLAESMLVNLAEER